jgi:predicted small secreted protein
MKKRIIALALVINFILILTGCNTIEGLGKDIKKAGEKIEDAAE